MSTDTSEKGLELLIVRALTGLGDEQILAKRAPGVAEAPSGYGGAGYKLGRSGGYRHGQLPRGGPRHNGHRAGRRGGGDRAGDRRGGRRGAGGGTRQPEHYRARVQRAVQRHGVEGRR